MRSILYRYRSFKLQDTFNRISISSSSSRPLSTTSRSSPTTDVRGNHSFDTEKLNEYFQSIGLQSKEGQLQIKQYSHGQSNPTFMVTTAGGHKYTVRKQPPGKLLPGAHAVDREYTVMSALSKTNVAVPTTRAYCPNAEILGTPFFIYDYVQGEFYKDASLRAIEDTPTRTTMYNNLVDSLARIHSVDISSLPDDYGKRKTANDPPEKSYVGRQIKTWTRQYRATETETIDDMNYLINELQHLLPADAEATSCLIHGDFRMDNVLFHEDTKEIAAVLDWELSTIGDGLSDLSYLCLSHIFSPKNPFMPGLRGLDVKSIGIPTIPETIKLYADRLKFHSKSDATIDLGALQSKMDYYMAFSLFRSCAILQGVYKRSLQGNASASNAGDALLFAKEVAALGVYHLRKYRNSKLVSSDDILPPVQPILKSNTARQDVGLFDNRQKMSDKASATLKQLNDFMITRVMPTANAIQEQGYQDNESKWTIHPSMEVLKSEAKALGLWNLFLPLETDGGKYGAGFTNLEYARMAELTGYCAIGPEVFNCNAPDTGNMEVLVRYASEEQKQQWLLPLLNGDIRSAFAMTEPAVASSDATNMQATIRQDGDELVLNGRKWWISGALDPRCKLIIFMGRTHGDLDSQGVPAHSRHSMVLVPMDSPGVRILRPMRVMGYDDAPHGHADMVFDNVRVPAANFVLGEGRGFEIAQGRLGPGRIHHCMRLIGAAEAALELMCQRVTERAPFGKPLAEQGSILNDIAKSRIEIDQARLLCLNAAHRMDVLGNKEAKADIAAIKIITPTMAKAVCERAMQAFGAMGLSQDTPLAHLWVWARVLQLADGPDEVHLAALGKQELANQCPMYVAKKRALAALIRAKKE